MYFLIRLSIFFYYLVIPQLKIIFEGVPIYPLPKYPLTARGEGSREATTHNTKQRHPYYQ